MNGTITEATRDESEKGIVNLDQGTFHRWLVKINANGEEISTDILRKPDSPDPTGEPVEQKPNGRWKVGQARGNGGHTFAGTGSDDKQHSITRQGAEQRAALYLIAKAMVKQHLDQDLTRDDFKKLCDWFVEDAKA